METPRLPFVDMRTPAEFEVSHLPGALLVPADTDALLEAVKTRFLQESSDGHPDVVCYCTVGYRSSRAAQLLSSSLAHFKTSAKIYNLRGGLVAWASEGRPMVDQRDKPTTVVHPYSSTWAKLLEPEFQAAVEG